MQHQLSTYMAFSSDVYGPRAANALNTMVLHLDTRNNSEDFHFHTQPTGTPFEADLLLSCTGTDRSAVGSVIYNGVLFAAGLQYDTALMNSITSEPIQGNMIPTLKDSIMEIRKEVHEATRPLCVGRGEDDAFSTKLLGPRIAKVLNGLLALEINAMNRGLGQRYFWSQYDPVFDTPDERRESFAMGTERGTMFAADLLIKQYLHNTPYNTISIFIRMAKPGEDFGLMDALLPYLGQDFTGSDDQMRPGNFARLVRDAINNVHEEMCTIVLSANEKAIPTLMASIPRLGSNSMLAKLEKGILCMIAQMAIS